MNKGERNRIKEHKFIQRLYKWNLLDSFEKGKGNFYVFKSHGKPCSCSACSSEKYSRKVKHKYNLQI